MTPQDRTFHTPTLNSIGTVAADFGRRKKKVDKIALNRGEICVHTPRTC